MGIILINSFLLGPNASFGGIVISYCLLISFDSSSLSKPRGTIPSPMQTIVFCGFAFSSRVFRSSSIFESKILLFAIPVNFISTKSFFFVCSGMGQNEKEGF